MRFGSAYCCCFVACLAGALTLSAPAETLQVGYAECFKARLPLKDFEQRHPEVEVSVTPHARNAWGHPDDRPFAANPDALPHVFPIHVGRYCADLPFLADRGLIEPLGDALVHLGLTQESFPPNVLEAVTYRGKIWAIPHHVLVDGLQVNRELAMILGINWGRNPSPGRKEYQRTWEAPIYMTCRVGPRVVH